MTTTISNKRLLADVSLTGENLALFGQTEMDEAGQVIELSGDIRLVNNPEAFVGSFSLYGININEKGYIQYRTEASVLVDRMTNEVNAGTALMSE